MTGSNHGCFSIENSEVLGLDEDESKKRVSFFDIFTATEAEREADNLSPNDLCRYAVQYPSVLQQSSFCRVCHHASLNADVKGNIRRVICPVCDKWFIPKQGLLTQAIYVRTGLSDGPQYENLPVFPPRRNSREESNMRYLVSLVAANAPNIRRLNELRTRLINLVKNVSDLKLEVARLGTAQMTEARRRDYSV